MLLVIVPGPVLLLIYTVNSLALVIPVTLNVPLKPELAVPTGFSVLTIFLTSTWDALLNARDFLRSYISSRLNDPSLPPHLKQLDEALDDACVSQSKINILLDRVNYARGIVLPSDYYFANGFPTTNFVVYADISRGRLGDRFEQLAKLVHAKVKLNLLIIFIK